MALPSLPFSFADLASGTRRITETINGILGFKHDDSRVRTAAEIALGINPVNFSYPPLNVKRYGAKGDGVTDDWHPINTAFKVAIEQGGGRIVLPDAGTYLLDSYDSASPLSNFPTQNSDGTVSTGTQTVVLYVKNAVNIDVDFHGSTIKYGSNVTFGDLGLTFDAFTNVRLLGPKFLGLQVPSGGVCAFGSLTGGSGYSNGTYTNVPLTGGTGNGAVATITVSAGAVSAVTIVYVGGGYAVNDSLSASNSDLGGAGSGFSITVTSISGAGPTVSTAAPDAVSLLCLSGSSSNFSATDLHATNCFSVLHATGNPDNTDLTIQGITLRGATQGVNVEYGIALHNAGDGCEVENLEVHRCARAFFLYGVHDVRIKAVGDQISYGFQSIIKAYSRSTDNIKVNYALQNMPGKTTVAPAIAIQVQSSLTTLPTVTNVTIDYTDRNVGFDANGPGQAISFDYFNDATQESSVTQQIFNGIIIRGASNNYVQTTVALSGAANFCGIDVTDYRCPFGPLTANQITSANGFVLLGRHTYTPTVQFGGASTGWTFSTNTAEYYVGPDGLCTVRGALVVSAKGTATGALTISAPLPSRLDCAELAFGRALGNSGMSSLTGAILATVTTGGGSTVAEFWQQGATGATAVSDGVFTSSSNLVYEFQYHT